MGNLRHGGVGSELGFLEHVQLSNQVVLVLTRQSWKGGQAFGVRSMAQLTCWDGLFRDALGVNVQADLVFLFGLAHGGLVSSGHVDLVCEVVGDVLNLRIGEPSA